MSHANEQKEKDGQGKAGAQKEYFVGVSQGVDEWRVERTTTASHKRCACVVRDQDDDEMRKLATER